MEIDAEFIEGVGWPRFWMDEQSGVLRPIVELAFQKAEVIRFEKDTKVKPK